MKKARLFGPSEKEPSWLVARRFMRGHAEPLAVRIMARLSSLGLADQTARAYQFIEAQRTLEEIRRLIKEERCIGIELHTATVKRVAQNVLVETAKKDAIAHHVLNETLREAKTKERAKGGNRIGVFYLIQLVPELSPHRIKMGWTSNLQERLKQHRCAAPSASILKSWPCPKDQEQKTITELSAGCQKIGTNGSEVFDCPDLAELIRRGNSWHGSC